MDETKNLDILRINDLDIPCIIGTTEWERNEKQSVIINIELSVAVPLAAKSDDLNDTVNYKKIYDDIVSLVAGSHFFLIEKLAQVIADVCLEDKRVRSVKVRLEKPKALPLARSGGIEIVRTNDH